MHEENKESHSTTLLLNTKTLAYRMVFRCVTIRVKSLRLFKQQSAGTLSAMDLPFNQPLCKKILISVWTKIYPTVFLSQAGNSDKQLFDQYLLPEQPKASTYVVMQGHTELQFVTVIAMIPYGYPFHSWAKQNLANLIVNYYNFERRTFSDSYLSIT